MIARAAEDRRAVRRRALRHGHARPAGRLRADLGPPARRRSGRGRPGGCGSRCRASASWPRSTGTWNGRCSSRGSTTPTTSGCTTACARGTPGRCASTSTPGSTIQDKLARFLENHDEPRAAATFAPGMHEAAAVITFLSPGLRFFHQGQFEGRRKRISPHLVRAPVEPSDERAATVLRAVCWRCCGSRPSATASGACSNASPAWDGNWTSDCFIAWSWQARDGQQRLVRGQLRRQPGPVLRPSAVRRPGRPRGAAHGPDGPARYDRDGNDLVARGLYLDLPPWGYHVFEVTPV